MPYAERHDRDAGARAARPRPVPRRERRRRRGDRRRSTADRSRRRRCGPRARTVRRRPAAPLAARLLPPAGHRRPPGAPARRPRPRRRLVLGPPRARGPGRRGHLLDGRVVPHAARRAPTFDAVPTRGGADPERCAPRPSPFARRRPRGHADAHRRRPGPALRLAVGPRRRRRCPTIRWCTRARSRTSPTSARASARSRCPGSPTGGPSIDHSLWFHEPIRADEWMLLELWPLKASGARGVYSGSLRERATAGSARCSPRRCCCARRVLADAARSGLRRQTRAGRLSLRWYARALRARGGRRCRNIHPAH